MLCEGRFCLPCLTICRKVFVLKIFQLKKFCLPVKTSCHPTEKVNETGPVNLAAMFFRIGENVMKIMLPRSLIVLRLCCSSLQLPFFPKAFCATHLQRIFGIPEDTRN